jgi:hypothetical protein
MAQITKPNTFTAGTTVVSAQVNSNFDTIYSEFNGNIDNNNIKAGAAIDDSKLATISTSGKVATSAISGTFSNTSFSALTVTTLQSTTITASNINCPNIFVNGAIYTIGWTDYSALTTITGWSSTTIKVVYYNKLWRHNHVYFYINGTSNTNECKFTLPYVAANVTNMIQGGLCEISMDTGTTSNYPSRIIMLANDNVVNIYKNIISDPWTTSGAKFVRGSFWYFSEA